MTLSFIQRVVIVALFFIALASAALEWGTPEEPVIIENDVEVVEVPKDTGNNQYTGMEFGNMDELFGDVK